MVASPWFVCRFFAAAERREEEEEEEEDEDKEEEDDDEGAFFVFLFGGCWRGSGGITNEEDEGVQRFWEAGVLDLLDLVTIGVWLE